MTVRIKNKKALWVIVPAAGVGSRFGTELPKQYAVMKNSTVLNCTLDALRQHPVIKNIMLVLHSTDVFWEATRKNDDQFIQTTVGGDDRVHSVLNGLLALSDELMDDDWVLVHDACRPYVSLDDLTRLLALIEDEHAVGGLLAIPLTDTIKQVESNRVIKTISRDHLWRAQTPQLFRYGILKHAIMESLHAGFVVTDESSAIEFIGLNPVIVQGSSRNIKITYTDEVNT